MNAIMTDHQGIRLRCSACQRVNRIPYSRLDETGHCGNCKSPLPPVGEPIEISATEDFDSLIQSAPVPVLTDFWAAWCGPCRMLAPELESVARSEAGRLAVAKVNTEELPLLADRFQISSIPAVVLLRNGQEADRIVGLRPAAEIVSFVQRAGQS